MTTTYTLEKTAEGTNLVVNGRWSSEAAAALRSGSADGLVLNYARGFQSDGSLGFITPELQARRLYLLDRSIEDPSPIARLGARLVHLSFEAAPGVEFDMSSTPHLRSVAATWAAIEKGVRFGSDLEVISTTRYDAPDLLPLCTHTGLRLLQLKEAPELERLTGLRSLHELETLRLMWAVRLNDISELKWVAKTLIELRMERCRGVKALDDLATLTRLRFLEYSDGSNIPSLAPLVGLRRLESLHLWGTTRTNDNDLSPLLHLEALRDFRIQVRKEYRPSATEIRGAH